MTLYEISDNYAQFYQFIEDNPDLPREAIDDTFESLDADLSEKADNIASYIKSLLAESDAISAEAKTLQERAKAKKAKADYLRDYLFSHMVKADRLKIETARNVLSVKKNPPSVEIFDLDLFKSLHPDLLVAKELEPNKNAIKALLKDGQEISGCKLTQGQSLTIK